MKKTPLVLLLCLFSFPILAQDNWDIVWQLKEYPFNPYVNDTTKTGSEISMIKAGFDTDEDGWGEFLCAWSDITTGNYILMYEATADNTYELVWYYLYPVSANTFPGIAVGDIDNNGKVDIVTTMPSVASGDTPNPPRLWSFEWSGVQGENHYGRYVDEVSEPTSEWNFDVDDNTDFRPYSNIIEDIDNDGVNELITGVRSGDRGREVVVSSVNGELSGFGAWQIEYNYAQSFGGSLYSVTTGDLDADGNNEIYALVWDQFTMRIFECTGNASYEEVFAVDNLYQEAGVDYGALDAVRVADVNNDGVMEMYIAGTESQNTLFMVTGISDVSAMTSDDIVEFYYIPVVDQGKFRAMYVADPDGDGNLSLMIAGEKNGQIYDLEYNGEGDPADSLNWTLNVIYDHWEESGFAPGELTPRFFYGHPATDMDKDGKAEYIFTNYSADFGLWEDDFYMTMIEIDTETGVTSDQSLIPNSIKLHQNYPNPFNPSTVIEFGLNKANDTKLVVYDLLGRKVATLVNEHLAAGTHRVNFDASNLAAGTYIYTLQTGDNTISNKMILLK